MPILRESRDFNAETPMNLQIEKPPRFILFLHYGDESGDSCNHLSSPLYRHRDNDSDRSSLAATSYLV
jgi:hypothetical protein